MKLPPPGGVPRAPLSQKKNETTVSRSILGLRCRSTYQMKALIEAVAMAAFDTLIDKLLTLFSMDTMM